jgi:PAS domain-containing protein
MAEHDDRADRVAPARGTPAPEVYGGRPPAAPLATAADYRDLIESLDAIVWESDTSGRFTFVSQRAEAILGFSLKNGFAHRVC